MVFKLKNYRSQRCKARGALRDMTRRALLLCRVIRRQGRASLNFHKKRTFGDFEGRIFKVCDILTIQNVWDSFSFLVYGILIWIHSRRAPYD